MSDKYYLGTRIGSVVGFLLVAFVAIGTLGTGVVGASAIDVDPADDSLEEIVFQSQNASEEPYEEPVPEPGDPYYEAQAADGSWISYVNPRDEYRSPYLGPGSGKLCVSLLDSDGNVIVGESIPDTTVTIPTGESLSWHTGADPMVVEFPLTEHYDRPLDADQFGTSEDLPQGDGYLDSHCIEFHGMDDTSTIEYGEAEIEGEGADRVEVVGYHQQVHQSWEPDVDPIEDAVGYEDAGGGWTYDPDHSHGQAVVVLQLDDDGDKTDEDADDDDATDASNDTVEDENDEGDASDDGPDQASDDESNDTDDVGEPNDSDEGSVDDDEENDPVPGLGVAVAMLAIALAVFLSTRRRT